MVERMRLVAEFDELGAAQELGFRSTAHWLTVECRIEPRTARDYLRVAHRLEAWPRVREAMGEGRLSYSQARALSRASAEEDEAALLRTALTSTVVALERHVRALRSAPSAEPDVAEAAHARRSVQWGWDEDGMLRFWGRLDPADGAALVEAVETGAARIRAPQKLRRPGLGARRADALGEIVRSGCPRTTVMLHADLASLAGTPGGEVLHLEDGPSIPAELGRRLTCDAMITVKGLNHGRSQRVVTPAQRRALEERDGRVCWMPGCDRCHELDAHHIVHWTRGGRTDLANLVLLCPYHHRLLHEGGWRLAMSRGDVLVVDRVGEVVSSRRAPGRASSRRRRAHLGRRRSLADGPAPELHQFADSPILAVLRV